MCLMPMIALASQEVERDRGTRLKGAEWKESQIQSVQELLCAEIEMLFVPFETSLSSSQGWEEEWTPGNH